MRYCFLLCLLVLGICTSCEDSESQIIDDTDTSTDDGEIQGAANATLYYSLTTGDNWQYDVNVDNLDTAQDELTVSGTTLIDNEIFATFEANEMPTGFMTNLLINGALAESESVLRYTGAINIPLDDQTEIDLEIPLLTIYNEAIESGEIIDQITENVTQNVEGIPITVDAIISTISRGTQENFTLDDQIYSSVIEADIEVNVTISATVLGATFVILQPQNVVKLSNIYAENIGLIHSDLNFQYEFEDLSSLGITLPFPASGERFVSQIIRGFDVAADD